MKKILNKIKHIFSSEEIIEKEEDYIEIEDMLFKAYGNNYLDNRLQFKECVLSIIKNNLFDDTLIILEDRFPLLLNEKERLKNFAIKHGAIHANCDNWKKGNLFKYDKYAIMYDKILIYFDEEFGDNKKNIQFISRDQDQFNRLFLFVNMYKLNYTKLGFTPIENICNKNVNWFLLESWDGKDEELLAFADNLSKFVNLPIEFGIKLNLK